MKFFRSSKCSKTIVELKFTTQKPNPCTPWIVCSVSDWKYPFRVNLVQKTQNCQFKMKSGTQINSNTEKYVVMFTFFVLDQKKTLLGKSGPTNQNCQFRLKFATRTNSNMRDSMIMFTASVFDHKYPSRVNLVQTFKIVCSK